MTNNENLLPKGRGGQTPIDLSAIGLNSVAYVRYSTEVPDAVTAEGTDVPDGGYYIYAANGQKIGWVPNLDMAQMAIRHNDMEMVTLQ